MNESMTDRTYAALFTFQLIEKDKIIPLSDFLPLPPYSILWRPWTNVFFSDDLQDVVFMCLLCFKRFNVPKDLRIKLLIDCFGCISNKETIERRT